MFDKPPTLCILGFGAFGRLVARLLAPHAEISVHDPGEEATRAAAALGYRVVEHPRDIAADIVILAVPVPALEGCLKALAPHLRAGQLVVDVCSVKEGPARLMQRLLPEHVEILATHPMFGPQSARLGLEGCQVVLCPVRGRRWRRIGAFLRGKLGLEVIVATPEEHDRQAALTQGLVHLLARAFAGLGDAPRIRTRSFTMMRDALALVAEDAPEVFEAITRGNRHVGPLCGAFSMRLAALGAAPGPVWEEGPAHEGEVEVLAVAAR